MLIKIRLVEAIIAGAELAAEREKRKITRSYVEHYKSRLRKVADRTHQDRSVIGCMSAYQAVLDLQEAQAEEAADANTN